MAEKINLPPGFVLDEPETEMPQTEAINLPPGFVLDKPVVEKPVPLLSTPAIETELERRKQPTRLERGIEKIIPNWQMIQRNIPSGTYHPMPARVLGEAIDIPIDIAQTLTQMLSNPSQIPEALLNIPKGILTSVGTTLRHPITSLYERPIQASGDVYLTGQAIKGVAKLGSMVTKKISPSAAKALSFTTGLPEEQISKAIQNPKKYVVKPLSPKEELAEFTKTMDSVIDNTDDVFNFRVKTLEDEVAKQSEKWMGGAQTGAQLNASNIKTQVSKYVNEMKDAGIIDDIPKPIERLYARIDRYAKPGYDSATGKWLKVIKFEDMHKMKQDLYKIMGDSYGKGNFDDVVAGAYKVAAKTANGEMRALSPEYAKANDGLKIIYDLYDEIGAKGKDLEIFTGKGATKRFRAYFNDPQGEQILRKLEDVIPENKRFMPKLEDLRETQEIRKAFQGSKLTETLLGGGMLSGAGFALGGPPGAAVGAYTGATLTSPRILGRNLRALEYGAGTMAKIPSSAGLGIGAGITATPTLIDLMKEKQQKAQNKTLRSAVLE